MTARHSSNMIWVLAAACVAWLILLAAYCAIQAAVLVMGAM